MHVSSLYLSWVTFRPLGVPELGCELYLVTQEFPPFEKGRATRVPVS